MQLTEGSLGRRKRTDEPGEAKTLGVRVQPSLRAYLESEGASPGAVAWDKLMFERELSVLLEDSITDLRISAAHDGQSYDKTPGRAATIARLVKAGLSAEKKPKGR